MSCRSRESGEQQDRAGCKPFPRPRSNSKKASVSHVRRPPPDAMGFKRVANGSERARLDRLEASHPLHRHPVVECTVGAIDTPTFHCHTGRSQRRMPAANALTRFSLLHLPAIASKTTAASRCRPFASTLLRAAPPLSIRSGRRDDSSSALPIPDRTSFK